jgi:hypothetical protein
MRTCARFEIFGKTCLQRSPLSSVPILTHSVATAKPTPSNIISHELHLPAPIANEVACSAHSSRYVDVVARRAAGTRQELHTDAERLEISKGLKGKGSSKGSSSDSECDSTRVFYWTKDLKKHSSEIEGSGGGNSTLGYTIDELPIYYIGQKKAGFLTEANIVTGDDCSYTGVFSFEPNDNGRSMNQIFYQGAFAGFSLRIVHVNLMPLPLLTYVSLLVTHRVVLVCHLERGHRRHWQIRLCLRDRQGIQKSKDARHP